MNIPASFLGVHLLHQTRKCEALCLPPLFLHLIISIPINLIHNFYFDQLHFFSYFQAMMFSSNASRFVLVLAAAFNTVASAKESKAELLTAEDCVILAKSGISTVPDSVITGDIAVSPIAGETMTGFNFTADSSGEFLTAGQLVGRACASDYDATTPALLTTAVSAVEAACTDAAGRVNPDAARINLAAGLLADLTLTPGVCTFGTDVEINLDIFFEGGGDGGRDRCLYHSDFGQPDLGRKQECDLDWWCAFQEHLLAGRGLPRGGRRCAPGGHPFGPDRCYFRDWVLPDRPRLGTDGLRPPEGKYHC
jgi:hypothetical protein